MENRRRKQRQRRIDHLEKAFTQVQDLHIEPTNINYDDWSINWGPIAQQVAANAENGKLNSIEWESLPSALDPFLGSTLTLLPNDRAIRKRQQLESLLLAVFPIIQDGDTICDFGSGAGHIGLLIAYYFPTTKVILIEHNPEKHKMIESRIEHLRSENDIECRVEIFDTIEQFQRTNRDIDIGVSLHSCGLLTDETLRFCVAQKASFVLVPCCYGQISGKTEAITSEVFQQLPAESVHAIVSAADFTVNANKFESDHTQAYEHFKVAKRCMCLVDHNRLQYAAKRGYHTQISSLMPLTCSPKNNLIIGVSPSHISSLFSTHTEIDTDVDDEGKNTGLTTTTETEEPKLFSPRGATSSTTEQDSNESHPVLLQEKLSTLLPKLRLYTKQDTIDEMRIYPCPVQHYRLRCRFGIRWRQDPALSDRNQINIEKSSTSEQLEYFVYEKGEQVAITEFSIASMGIQRAMKLLLQYITPFEQLVSGLQAVHFLHALSGDLLITLIYNQTLKEQQWTAEAEQLLAQLRLHVDNINVLGKSKNKRLIVNDKDYVNEVLTLKDSSQFLYRQYEGSFSNPNGRINEQCLDWLRDTITFLKNFKSDRFQEINLLELYCGAANHTIPLSSMCNRIEAVELDKKLVQAANYNIQQNKVTRNVKIVQLHSHKYCQTYSPSTSDFNVILVDPPRAGLDEVTLKTAAKFPVLIYISCNPEALFNNLVQTFSHTHSIVRVAAFDQFAYTHHMEVAICAIHKNLMECHPITDQLQ